MMNAFKPDYLPEEKPKKLEYQKEEFDWMYDPLDPSLTAQLAYKNYSK